MDCTSGLRDNHEHDGQLCLFLVDMYLNMSKKVQDAGPLRLQVFDIGAKVHTEGIHVEKNISLRINDIVRILPWSCGRQTTLSVKIMVSFHCLDVLEWI